MKSVREAQRHNLLCCNELLADGWREFPPYPTKSVRCFYKQFVTTTRCRGNDETDGVYIRLTVAIIDKWPSMEITLCAGLTDDTWIRIQNYALPETVHRVIGLIPRMLAMWELANTQVHEKT